ncbi:MAG TPA: hypothetical protein VGK19_24530 [Capsulimonadaceae bacterium]|jgi:hypothetical protein
MARQLTIIQERKLRAAEKEEMALSALYAPAKKHDELKLQKRQKKKTTSELEAYLSVWDIRDKVLREPESFKSRSYNLSRQVFGLINHMFVKYPVPYFMFQACLHLREGKEKSNAWHQRRLEGFREDRFDFMHDLYRDWFVTLAQGGSFTKKVKGLMTSMEAHTFLSGPPSNLIHENLWWAKMVVAGIPLRLVDKLVGRIFTSHWIDDADGRLMEVIHFYARYHPDMSRAAFEEITDFIDWQLRNSPAVRCAGRTITSMIKLSNEWHVEVQKAKLGSHIEWAGMAIPDWMHEEKAFIWDVVQLLNNKELLNEGRKQRHCVYSYVNYCLSGRTAIFSLRRYPKAVSHCEPDGTFVYHRLSELTRITIEVQGRAVVQARGNLNRALEPYEKDVLKIWAGSFGITIADSARRWM